MSRSDRARPTDSIFIRVLIFVAIVSVIMTSFLTFNAIRSSQESTTQTALRLGAEITDLLAQQAGGALKFRKAEDVQTILDAALSRLEGQASSGLGIAADGSVMGAVPAQAADESFARSLGERAIAENAPVVDRDVLVFAAPARFGNADAAAGAIVIRWDTATLKAEIARQTRSAVLAGGLMLILQMAILGYVLRRMIARPLNTVAAAMATVADGNYDTEIPHFRRGNEVGVVARALESFRDKLKASDGAAKMAAFKAAGLENTTKAVMIADGDLKVSYVNPAYMRLMIEHIAHLRGRLPQFDPDTIIGTSIDIFHAHPEKTRKLLENLDGAYEAEIEFGPILFGLSISPINDSENRRIGYVTEWAYVSEERRNAAVLETFENRQAMAEFAADGTLVSANEIVAKLAGRPAANIHGTPLSALVCDAEGQPLCAVDDAIFGDFQITSQDGAAGHVTGGLTPIRNRAGEITKIILIGADVTAQRRELQAAAAQQARMQADQDRMIEALRDGLAKLSDGDLMVRLETPFSGDHDRLRHDFNGALGRLNEAISAVSSHSTAIRRDVGDITDAANNLSRRTEHQAATLEETAAALTELTVSVNSAAEGARKANDVVTEARTNAEKSGGVVRDAVEAMGAIAESSSKISNIISVIDDIAFQTNLLALNAGVEAARAGDAGRGFAVVASEVRALAQRSSDAAREINTLISASGEHVTRGVTLVGDAGEALKQIVSSVSVISDHVSTIASSAAEQSGGLVEINEAMGQLDQVTQQNAAMFEETTAAAQALSSAADELSGAVAHFHVRPSELGVPRPAPVQAPLATGTTDSTPHRTEVDLDGDWAEF